jgi:hypothetical protein
MARREMSFETFTDYLCIGISWAVGFMIFGFFVIAAFSQSWEIARESADFFQMCAIPWLTVAMWFRSWDWKFAVLTFWVADGLLGSLVEIADMMIEKFA